MPLADATLNAARTTIKGQMTHATLHANLTNATNGTSPLNATRLAVTWSDTTAGDFGLASSLAFTGLGASAAVGAIALWTAATGGSVSGYFTITGDATANSAGEYTVTTLNINGSSS